MLRHGVHHWQTLLLIALLLLVISSTTLAQPGTQSTRAVYLPVITKPLPIPRPTTSYYVLDTHPRFLQPFQLVGCAGAVEMQRQGIQQGFVALLFGAPAYSQDRTSHPDGYGTLTPDGNYATLGSIEDMVASWLKGFAIGYSSDQYLCGLRPGQPPIRPRVVLAIGVTNESLKLPPLSTSTNAQQTQAVTYTVEGHGAAWAGLITRLRNHVALNG